MINNATDIYWEPCCAIQIKAQMPHTQTQFANIKRGNHTKMSLLLESNVAACRANKIIQLEYHLKFPRCCEGPIWKSSQFVGVSRDVKQLIWKGLEMEKQTKSVVKTLSKADANLCSWKIPIMKTISPERRQLYSFYKVVWH